MPIAEFTLEGANGAKVMVEVDAGPSSAASKRLARTSPALIDAADGFEASLASIKAVASRVLSVVRELGPDEGEVSMGFKLTAESGVILAKVSGEATIGLKLVWKKAVPAPSSNG